MNRVINISLVAVTIIFMVSFPPLGLIFLFTLIGSLGHHGLATAARRRETQRAAWQRQAAYAYQVRVAARKRSDARCQAVRGIL